MKPISFVEFSGMILLGLMIWVANIIASFVWLGWIPNLLGNLLVWIWSKSKNIKYKNPSHEMLVHLCGSFASLIPAMPSVLGQIIFIYAQSKAQQVIGRVLPPARGEKAEAV
jgi:hypothetical protein